MRRTALASQLQQGKKLLGEFLTPERKQLYQHRFGPEGTESIEDDIPAQNLGFFYRVTCIATD
jgi:hypothetical protein